MKKPTKIGWIAINVGFSNESYHAMDEHMQYQGKVGRSKNGSWHWSAWLNYGKTRRKRAAMYEAERVILHKWPEDLVAKMSSEE